MEQFNKMDETLKMLEETNAKLKETLEKNQL